jgi:hypothetical protein
MHASAATPFAALSKSVGARMPKHSIVLLYAFAARAAMTNVDFETREERLKNPATCRESVAASLAAQLPLSESTVMRHQKLASWR